MRTHKWFVSMLAAVAVLVAIAPARAANIDSIVFFGDSLSDTGNVWYATGGAIPPPPYNQGSNGGPPDFTGGQWSDWLGPSWPSVLAGRVGLYATPSVVGGNNYAWGGGRTGVNPDSGGVPWLDQQVAQYLAFGSTPTDTTLYSLMIGGNDIANNLSDPATAILNGMTSLGTQLANLYGAGARQFLVANVPDIGATPRFQELDQSQPGIAAFATLVTQQWNLALAALLGQLSLPGADIALFDLYGLGKNPALLAGYENITDACLTEQSVCSDPTDYFYWDSFHPTSRTHRTIAEYAARAVGLPVPEPATLALMLLGGLAAVGARRARR